MAITSLKAAESMSRGNVVQVAAGEAELWDNVDTHPYGVALEDAKAGDLVSIQRGGDDALVYVLCDDEVFVGSVLTLGKVDGRVSPFDPSSAPDGPNYILGSASTAAAPSTLCRINIDRFLILIPEQPEV